MERWHVQSIICKEHDVAMCICATDFIQGTSALVVATGSHLNGNLFVIFGKGGCAIYTLNNVTSCAFPIVIMFPLSQLLCLMFST